MKTSYIASILAFGLFVGSGVAVAAPNTDDAVSAMGTASSRVIDSEAERAALDRAGFTQYAE